MTKNGKKWLKCDSGMPVQCHCHNYLDPNSPKAMSHKKVFYFCILSFLISSNIWSYHAPLSLLSKVKYKSENLQQNQKLYEGGSPSSTCFSFLDRVFHHSSSFISFLLILSSFKPASPSSLTPSPSDHVCTTRDTFRADPILMT